MEQFEPAVQWVPKSAVTERSNCPAGMEHLLQMDHLLVKQQVELLEALTGFETANKYLVSGVRQSRKTLVRGCRC